MGTLTEGAAATTAAKTPLGEALEEQTGYLNQLSDILSDLRTKLAPIRLEKPMSQPEETKGKAAESEIVQILQTNNGRLGLVLPRSAFDVFAAITRE